MNHLNFSWVISDKLAGSAAPSCMEDLVWLKNKGILALVRMAEQNKRGTGKHHIEQLGFWDCYEPVPDFTAPSPAQISRMVEFISRAISSGRPVAVFCGAGLEEPERYWPAISLLRDATPSMPLMKYARKRPGSIETKAQEEAVMNYSTVKHAST